MPLSIQPAGARDARPGRASFAGAILIGLLGACASSGSGGAGGNGGVAGTTGTGGAAGTGSSTAGTTGTAGAGAVGTGGGQSAGSAGSGGTAGTGGTSGSGGRAGTSGGGGGASGTAGTAGGAGTSGGAGGGGAGGGAAFGCAGKTYKLCEDFETGTVGAIPTGWTALNGFGSDASKGVGLANDQHNSGSMALKSNSMVPGEERVQRSLAALGATATKHWGRIFYKVQSPAPKPASGVIHVTLAALQGTTENRVVDTVEQSNGTHQWIYNVPDDSCCTGSAYSWSFDSNWHCAEWFVDVTAKSFRFFTDNTEVTSIGFTGNANAKMSNYTAIAVGTIFYQTPPSPFVIWFDDLAIDDSQIHCQ